MNFMGDRDTSTNKCICVCQDTYLLTPDESFCRTSVLPPSQAQQHLQKHLCSINPKKQRNGVVRCRNMNWGLLNLLFKRRYSFFSSMIKVSDRQSNKSNCWVDWMLVQMSKVFTSGVKYLHAYLCLRCNKNVAVLRETSQQQSDWSAINCLVKII